MIISIDLNACMIQEIVVKKTSLQKKVKHVIHVIATRPTLVSIIVHHSLSFCENVVCLDQVCNGLITFIADGFCDDENNNVECYFDGGDCCFDVETYFCDDCHCYYGKDNVTTLFVYIS